MNTQIMRVFISGFALLNALVIVGLWYNGSAAYITSGTIPEFCIALGRLTGLFAQAALLLQIILIGRIPWIEQYFGYDKMNQVHRTLGYWLLALFLLHPVFLVIGYAGVSESGYLAQFASFLKDWPDVGNALLGVILMVLVALSSLHVIRSRMKYEAWYGFHFVTYLAVFFVFDHQTKSGDVSSGLPLWYWITLNGVFGALFLLYRWIRPLYLSWKHQFRIQKVVTESPGVVSLYIEGNAIGSYTFRAGQYAQIRIKDKQSRPFKEKLMLWFPHPFSFSAAPNNDTIRFSVKSLGDFTSLLPTLTPGTRVTLSGPLGRFTVPTAITEKFLLIAGGIGITPLRALAEELHALKKDTVLLYCARTNADLALLSELKSFSSIKLICLTSDAAETDAPTIVRGMITDELLKKLVPDLVDRDAYVCGPPPMMDALVKTLGQHGVPKSHIHCERFAF